MLKRVQTAGRFIRRFGVVDGLSAYAKLALAKRTSGNGNVLQLHLPVSSSPVHLRPRGADAHAFWQVFVAGDYDVPVPFSPSVIVDAGAHVGYASLYFAHRFPHARVVAIEPEPGNAQLLQRNLATNERVDIRHRALWSMPARLRIANPDAQSWSFRVTQGNAAGQDVETITLAEIIGQFGRIDILKMDIEGAELDVFRGNPSWLAHTGMVIIELHERYAPGCTALIEGTMQAHGFQRWAERGENVVFLSRN